VVGAATADALQRDAAVRADLVPPEHVAESLVDVFPTGIGRVLLVRAAVARDVVPTGLADKGWSVDVADAYRTVPVSPTEEQLDAVRTADVVTFTSSSTVDSFVAAFGTEKVPSIVACIGPVTAATARDHGLHVDVEADVHTIDGLVDALVEEFGG
jgi:uroporphyrinogen-III synthase